MSEPVLALSGIERTFRQGAETLQILRGVDLEVGEGEIVALVGPSGSGKSTLLQIAGLLERPDAGKIAICGEAVSVKDDDKRTLVRRQSLGFVYQYHHLLAEFSARENVVLPQMIAGVSRSRAGERADELLHAMGLAGRVTHRPARLSGGEQQRVAIARALANRPRLLLADEPTGNLDPGTAGEVFQLLLTMVRTEGLAALVATHNAELAASLDRTLTLSDGRLA